MITWSRPLVRDTTGVLITKQSVVHFWLTDTVAPVIGEAAPELERQGRAAGRIHSRETDARRAPEHARGLLAGTVMVLSLLRQASSRHARRGALSRTSPTCRTFRRRVTGLARGHLAADHRVPSMG